MGFSVLLTVSLTAKSKYQVNLQFTIWHFLANFVLMCLVYRWSGAHDRALAGIYGVEYSALDAYQLLISVNSCFIVIFWAQFSTVLFMITHPRHKLMTPPSYVWSRSVHRVRFPNCWLCFSNIFNLNCQRLLNIRKFFHLLQSPK